MCSNFFRNLFRFYERNEGGVRFVLRALCDVGEEGSAERLWGET